MWEWVFGFFAWGASRFAFLEGDGRAELLLRRLDASVVHSLITNQKFLPPAGQHQFFITAQAEVKKQWHREESLLATVKQTV